MFRPSTGQKIDKHSQPSDKKVEDKGIKKIEEDYDMNEEQYYDDEEILEVIQEEKEDEIAEDATEEDKAFFKE